MIYSLPKYELCRHANSALHAAIQPFLIKYPPLGEISQSEENQIHHYTWDARDHAKVHLSISDDDGATVGLKVERIDDPKDKSLMMKLVSVGYSSKDVEVRSTIASILSELLDA